jgi:hypothetical protein
MEAKVRQHRAFEKGLKKFEEHVTSATPETYDGKKVKKAVGGFGQILAVHLSDEIQTLIGLQKYGGDKLADPWEKFNKKILEDVIKDKVYLSLIWPWVEELLTGC